MKFLFILLLTAGIVSAQSVSSSGGSSGGASSNDFKENVRVATTANITIATALNNGDTLDGVTLATGNRVLVKNQSTPSQNGIYTVSASPARASDSNTWAKIAGSLVAVGSEGTTNRNKIFLNDSAPTGTLGSTSLSYIEKAASGMGSGDALVANPLSQFAATTSNQLLTTLNDETGTGVSVFGTSPTFTTSLLTGSTTFSLFNSTATTLNFGGAATTLNIGSSAATILNFGGSTTAAQFRFLEPSGSGTNYTGFKAQAQAGNVTYTLPAADGTSGQVLSTNGSGILSWATGGSGGLTGSAGGNGAADSGKAALFDAAGSLTATTELTVKNASTASHAYLADDGTIGFHFAGETNPREISFPDDVLENEAKFIATRDWVAAQGYGSSGSLTSTYIGYGSGANALTGEAAFNYTAASDLLTVPNITVSGTATLGTLAITNLNTTNLALGGVTLTATGTELNILDGVTSSAAELNYVDGVTSAIQTQLNAKAAGSFGITVDGGGSVLTTGSKGFAVIPFACTITGWSIVSNASGNIEFDVEKAVDETIPSTSIVASAPPLLTGAQIDRSTTLTGWTTAVAANDVIEFEITGTPATITRATLQIHYTR